MTVQPSGGQPVLQGRVVIPDAVLDPASKPAHDFFNVIRTLVQTGVGVFTHEGELQSALDSVTTMEKAFIKRQDHSSVISEADAAPREDVTQRKPAAGANVPQVPVNAPPIDYNALAKALLAAQQEQRQVEADSTNPHDNPEE